MAAAVDHPLFARLAAFMAAREGPVEEDRRRDTLAGLSGRVIEIGSGSGPNFSHYPEAVTELIAVEPEAHLRAKAVEAARQSGRPIRMIDAVADRLPFEDGAFDAAVAVLVLCSVPSQPSALAELHRVVRPGGELRFYEHVVGTSTRLAAAAVARPGPRQGLRRLPRGPRHRPRHRGGRLPDRALPALPDPHADRGAGRAADPGERPAGLSPSSPPLHSSHSSVFCDRGVNSS